MRFTENEMVFFNSITRGNAVLGIPLNFRIKDSEDEEIKRTIRGLIKKSVLDSETQLSKLGVLPARAFECYKLSSRHVIINYMHIAFYGEDESIVIVPLDNGEYELVKLPRVAILYLLLDRYPVLRKAGEAERKRAHALDMDEFLRKLKEYDGNIMTGEFYNNMAVREQVFYWDSAGMYRYDLNRHVQRESDPVSIRRELVRMLGVDMEVNKNV